MSSYQYRITVETLSTPKQTMEDCKPSFSFKAGLHDDLFHIVEVMRKSQVVEENEPRFWRSDSSSLLKLSCDTGRTRTSEHSKLRNGSLLVC